MTQDSGFWSNSPTNICATSGKSFFFLSPSFPICLRTLILSASIFQIWLMRGPSSKITWRSGEEQDRCPSGSDSGPEQKGGGSRQHPALGPLAKPILQERKLGKSKEA